ncbi:putative DNA polymerase I/3'-5' exonuclease [Pseudomonas phage Lu11]|uniref:putative DNA polymerase I/3'-5' exonuclease n=1 Tax=Pseudomonas phage Lu11 TaxID=1161927 RepID=UPI00025F153B|nr:putative DNA polymerase I/3'-5' exonuclease [Pseudomonas phage Lu11]AFH14628.1 putative DNA polymerase I/3'-5' exonuclease [Pseudomonas phage Lu11]
MKYEYVEFTHKYGKALRQYDVTGFDDVQLAKHTTKKPRGKILFVLDYMPGEALRRKKIFDGATGDLFGNLIWAAEDYNKAPNKLDDYNWLAISYHSFKTVGGVPAFMEIAHAEFKKRLEYIITTYKPDTVVTFGPDPTKALNGDYISQHVGNKGIQWQHFYGVPISTTVTHKDKRHKFKHVSTLSLRSLQKDDETMAAAGYVSRNLTTALNDGKLMYKVPKLDYEIVMVDTIKKFDKMMKVIINAEVVAIDTESRSLNRRKNYTVTYQFATETGRAFILPLFHKDTPFLPKELEYIKKELRDYFEYKSKNKYNLYANAAFDLIAARRDLGVRWFKTRLWCVIAAEFAKDENHKAIRGITGRNYYSLLNITMQYGCRAYYESDFGKEQRAFIADMELEGPVLTYMAVDVIVLLHIHRLQMKYAKTIGYKKYESVVSHQLSDQIHTLSNLEFNGSFVDIDWLFQLKSKDSHIVKERNRVVKELYASEGVQKANKLLAKRAGVPSMGLFGRTKTQLFSIRKSEHKELLFFEVLKLKPLSVNKKGKGKIDKDFQKKYKDVPEIALFTELTKIEKLYNAYVKSFIKKWSEDEDFRYDRCMRPRFGYLDVVTGRTSARDPTLQTIPTRSKMGKLIKRLFVSPKGRIIIKVDYAVHEVRCWSLISGDKDVAKAFRVGMDLRDRFRTAPNKELGQEWELKGDIHKVNASFFFRIPIEKIEKPKRDSVKQVIFGLIYQQGEKGTAKAIDATVEMVRDLTTKFFKRFPVGAGWFDKIKEHARKFLYVESPLGRRRNLWGLMTPQSHEDAGNILSRSERQSVNSPVQGMGSDFMMTGARQIERQRFEHYQKTGHYPDFIQANSVHDSLEFSCAYEDVWLAITMIEKGLTSAVEEQMIERHGFKFDIPLAIDFEFGYALDQCEGWNYSLTGDFGMKDKDSLDTILKKTLEGQRDVLKYDVDVKKTMKLIMSRMKEDGPEWALKQAKYWKKKGVKI